MSTSFANKGHQRSLLFYRQFCLIISVHLELFLSTFYVFDSFGELGRQHYSGFCLLFGLFSMSSVEVFGNYLSDTHVSTTRRGIKR